MPTGYTADVQSGKITDFNEYALQCARAFGACLMLRDEPMSSEIPTFKSSRYHIEARDQAVSDLAALDGMSLEECAALQAKEYDDAVAYRDKRLAEIADERGRYEAMLTKAKAFKAPTTEHEGYAMFLVSQLEESIKFDCGTEYHERPIEKLPVEQWRQERRANLEHDIDYHTKHQAEEDERTASRNEWVRQLKAALSV